MRPDNDVIEYLRKMEHGPLDKYLTAEKRQALEELAEAPLEDIPALQARYGVYKQLHDLIIGRP